MFQAENVNDWIPNARVRNGIPIAKLVKNENPLFTSPLVNRCFTMGLVNNIFLTGDADYEHI